MQELNSPTLSPEIKPSPISKRFLKWGWSKLTGHFAKDVMVVAGGTAIAQVISTVLSPIITRIYGPEAFGALSVFTSIVAVIASIASLSYGLSVVLPKRNSTAFQLFKISVLIGAVCSVAVTLLFGFFKASFVALFNLSSIAPFLLLVPVSVFLSTLIQSLEQWQSRTQGFKTISAAVVSQSIFSSVARIGIGIYTPSAAVLITLGLIAQTIQTYVLSLTAWRGLSLTSRRSRIARERPLLAMLAVARRYRDFPLYSAPQVFLNNVSRSAPILLLASLFNPSIAGLYAIAQSVLYLPISLISQSVAKVFLQRLATQANARQALFPMVFRATNVLALLGIVPFSVIMLAGPWLFSFAFGSKWYTAGVYARWMGIWLYFNFINVPAVQSLYVTNNQKAILVWEIWTTVVKIILLLLAGLVTKNSEFTIASYSIFGAIAYIAIIFMGYINSQKFDSQLISKKEIWDNV